MNGSVARYNGVAQALHWIIAILVICAVIIGLFHDALEPVLGKGSMGLHKSIGLTVLALSVVRLIWRLTHTPPPLPSMPGWQRISAGISHALFYVLMLGLPIGGYIFSSAGKYPLAWFGVPVPKMAITKDNPIVGIAHEGHEIGGWLMAGLIVLHIGAALYHHYGRSDRLIARMMPGRG